MWIYSQSTGQLWNDAGRIVCYNCYSGAGEGKNNPAMQGVRNVGPIPRGRYKIGQPYDSKQVGRFALPLTPVGHDALGRTNFCAHGDSISDPGNASEGCPIMPPWIRRGLHKSGDDDLKVIE